ncbi:hypothetical protein [Paenibacillus physcomitrellae]|uniref:Uncharacterized protein n=1 Tax=Paenibacillus physcomitrellae TaxID=1619311 RepID=A0ABQ1GS32_9BACL|nr:hypothetical protein [Paenibacillus physcomitrellae]GGA49221.1 hypothetical protein GCM10010917_38110 [Paenibacillus physcomitrellae]
MNEKWGEMKKAAKDAVSRTLENGFDVLKTAKELNESFTKKSDSDKK